MLSSLFQLICNSLNLGHENQFAKVGSTQLVLKRESIQDLVKVVAARSESNNEKHSERNVKNGFPTWWDIGLGTPILRVQVHQVAGEKKSHLTNNNPLNYDALIHSWTIRGPLHKIMKNLLIADYSLVVENLLIKCQAGIVLMNGSQGTRLSTNPRRE